MNLKSRHRRVAGGTVQRHALLEAMNGKTLTYGTMLKLAALSLNNWNGRIAKKLERGAGRISRPPCRKGPVDELAAKRLGAFVGGFDAGSIKPPSGGSRGPFLNRALM